MSAMLRCKRKCRPTTLSTTPSRFWSISDKTRLEPWPTAMAMVVVDVLSTCVVGRCQGRGNDQLVIRVRVNRCTTRATKHTIPCQCFVNATLWSTAHVTPQQQTASGMPCGKRWDPKVRVRVRVRVRACVRAFVRACVRACVRSFVRACVRACVCACG